MNEEEQVKISKSIKKILDKNRLLTLSTSSNNKPYSNTCFYASDKNINLYIWSEENTTHSENLRKNKKIAVNIFDSRQKWGSLLHGIQAIGTAIPVTNKKELIKTGILYIKRFPKVLKIVKNPLNFNNKVFESRIYKISLKEIKIFDEKAFGKGDSRKILLNKKWKK